MGGDPKVPLLKVKRGTPVVLALNNQTAFVQPMHLHGHAFRLLHGLDDGWEPYFLDTLQVPENTEPPGSPSWPTIPASGCSPRR